MQAVILDTGQAAPAGRRKAGAPIPLTPVAGRPLVEYLLDFLFRGGVESASVCSCGADYHRYLEWLRGCGYTGRVEIVGGGANGQAGPLHDLSRLLTRVRPADGVVVTSGDRQFDFPFSSFTRFLGERDGDVVVVSEDRENASGRCGVAVVTANERVIEFAAPPKGRRRGLSAIPLVYLSSETAACLERYLAEGNDGACIGSFLEWTYRFRPLYAFPMEGRSFHLTGPASLRRFVSHFEKARGI